MISPETFACPREPLPAAEAPQIRGRFRSPRKPPAAFLGMTEDETDRSDPSRNRGGRRIRRRQLRGSRDVLASIRRRISLFLRLVSCSLEPQRHRDTEVHREKSKKG